MKTYALKTHYSFAKRQRFGTGHTGRLGLDNGRLTIEFEVVSFDNMTGTLFIFDMLIARLYPGRLLPLTLRLLLSRLAAYRTETVGPMK